MKQDWDWHNLGREMTGIEKLRAVLERDLRYGLAHTLGLQLIEVDDGRVVIEATPGENTYNPFGTVPGGFTSAILDSACGWATQTKMGPAQGFATLELKVSYLKAITKEVGLLRAEGRVISIGRRVSFTEATLTDAEGRVYATCSSTLLVFPMEPAD